MVLGKKQQITIHPYMQGAYSDLFTFIAKAICSENF
jgi:hypothetical protein